MYYYYQQGRGKAAPELRGPRTKIAGDPMAPVGSPANMQFWAELNAIVASEVTYTKGTLGALIELYMADDAYTSLAERTRIVYALHLNRMRKPAAWGMLPVNSLSTLAVKMGRDALKSTPGMANQMLSVGRTLYDWGMIYDQAKANPFDKVPPLDVPDRGHIPWPLWAVEYVCGHAPPDLVRLVRLGIATCQRESDLVRLGPDHRAAPKGGAGGIWCRAQKTRRKRKSVFIPLLLVDALELDRWAAEPVLFTATRWKQPIARHRADLYLYSPKAAPYSPTSLRARYGRWLASPEGQVLRERWRAWVEEMKARYEWDVEAEDIRGPTIHGLRGTGILRRFGQGFDTGQIANDIGASRQTVEHYMRFKDQMQVAGDGRQRLRVIET